LQINSLFFYIFIREKALKANKIKIPNNNNKLLSFVQKQ